MRKQLNPADSTSYHFLNVQEKNDLRRSGCEKTFSFCWYLQSHDSRCTLDFYYLPTWHSSVIPTQAGLECCARSERPTVHYIGYITMTSISLFQFPIHPSIPIQLRDLYCIVE